MNGREATDFASIRTDAMCADVMRYVKLAVGERKELALMHSDQQLR
jgi:hypothetical protein